MTQQNILQGKIINRIDAFCASGLIVMLQYISSSASAVDTNLVRTYTYTGHNYNLFPCL